MFRKATAQDAPVDLASQVDLVDLFGRPLLIKGTKLGGYAEQQAILARGAWVWCGALPPLGQIPLDAHRPVGPVESIEVLHDRLRELFSRPRCPDNFADLVWNLARDLRTLVAKSPRAVAATLQFLSHPGSALLNSIHAAAICEIVAAKLGVDDDERHSFVCAALTMNLSVFDLQDELSVSCDRPDPEAAAALQTHPESACAALEAAGIRDEIWLHCVRGHHMESLPEKDDDLSLPLRLILSSDKYVALTASRGARGGLHPSDALTQMISEPARFDPVFVQIWGDFLGDFPFGSCFSRKNNIFISLGAAGNEALLLALSSGAVETIPLPAEAGEFSPSKHIELTPDIRRQFEEALPRLV